MTDTEQRQYSVEWWAKAIAAFVVTTVSLLGGRLVVSHVESVNNEASMLEQHMEVMRNRVDYLEEWTMKHNRKHMDDSGK